MIKLIHQACAPLTFVSFAVRGVWMIADSPRLGERWVKITPHVIDTIFLLSAIVLTLRIRQYPFTHAWLTAKLIALLVYVALGMVALRIGQSNAARVTAWAAALRVFVYIVLIAMSRKYSIPPGPIPRRLRRKMVG